MKEYPPVWISKNTYSTYLMDFETTPGLLQDAEATTTDSIDTSQSHTVVLFYQKKGYLQKTWAAAVGGTSGLVLAGVFVATNVISLGTASVVWVPLAVVGVGAGYYFGSEKPADWQAGVMLIPYTEETLKFLQCTELPVAQENK